MSIDDLLQRKERKEFLAWLEKEGWVPGTILRDEAGWNQPLFEPGAKQPTAWLGTRFVERVIATEAIDFILDLEEAEALMELLSKKEGF